ncbi:MAG: hypothetical protein N4A47_03610 [Clostridia bacterium]|nr:hypothetical protein [Clostridia bacterium]
MKGYDFFKKIIMSKEDHKKYTDIKMCNEALTKEAGANIDLETFSQQMYGSERLHNLLLDALKSGNMTQDMLKVLLDIDSDKFAIEPIYLASKPELLSTELRSELLEREKGKGNILNDKFLMALAVGLEEENENDMELLSTLVNEIEVISKKKLKDCLDANNNRIYYQSSSFNSMSRVLKNIIMDNNSERAYNYYRMMNVCNENKEAINMISNKLEIDNKSRKREAVIDKLAEISPKIEIHAEKVFPGVDVAPAEDKCMVGEYNYTSYSLKVDNKLTDAQKILVGQSILESHGKTKELLRIKFNDSDPDLSGEIEEFREVSGINEYFENMKNLNVCSNDIEMAEKK